jgi:hypothetical protein
MPTSPASPFADLRSFQSEVDEERLPLPIGGVTYEFSKSIPFRTGLVISAVRAEAEGIKEAVEAGDEPDTSALDKYDEQQTMRDLFGDQWDRMVADGVKTSEFRHVYETLFAWHMAGQEAALLVWERREGDARPPARSASKARKTSPRSSSRKTSPRTAKTHQAGGTSSRAGT